MLEALWWFFQLVSQILSLFGVFMVGVFLFLAWDESYKWAWHEMVKRPLARAKVRRRARKRFNNTDFSDSTQMVSYSQADVDATIKMYEGVYVFPEELAPYSRHPVEIKEDDDEVPGPGQV